MPKRYSVWHEGAVPPLELPRSVDVHRRDWDVVIVGGGIAGLLAALRIRETGRDVCVVEASRVGEGTTASATVKVTSGHGAVLSDLASRHGLATAVAYQRANDRAFTSFAQLVSELPEPVEWHVAPHIVYGSTNEAIRRLRVTEIVATYAGSDVSRAESPRWSHGEAWSWASCALVHPLSLARALSRLLLSRGVPILEAARVVAVKDNSELPVVHLADGRAIRSRDVVIATHAPVHDPDLIAARFPVFRHPVIASRIHVDEVHTTYDVDGLSTRPITLPSGERGAVIVGPPCRPGGITANDWGQLEEWSRVALRADPPQYVWGAQDVQRPDLLPHAARSHRSPHVIVVTGFNAWGFTNAMAAADEVARLIDSNHEDGSAQPGFWRDHDDTSMGSLATTASGLWWGARSLTTDALVSLRTAGDPAPGEGWVSGGPLAPRATCRTSDGVIHQVSARCTHVGCLVRWNRTEQSWDCPCHGSRFAPDGSVLEGPASEPLGA